MLVICISKNKLSDCMLQIVKVGPLFPFWKNLFRIGIWLTLQKLLFSWVIVLLEFFKSFVQQAPFCWILAGRLSLEKLRCITRNQKRYKAAPLGRVKVCMAAPFSFFFQTKIVYPAQNWYNHVLLLPSQSPKFPQSLEQYRLPEKTIKWIFSDRSIEKNGEKNGEGFWELRRSEF